MLLLATKPVQGHRFRLVYSEQMFLIQRAGSDQQWVTVHADPVEEGARYFWNHDLTQREPRRIMDPRRH